MKKFISLCLLAGAIAFGCRKSEPVVYLEPTGPFKLLSSGELWGISVAMTADPSVPIVVDRLYQTFPTNGWEVYLPPVTNNLYRSDSWDCDDYAFAQLIASRDLFNSIVKKEDGSITPTLAIGIIGYIIPWADQGHAANVVLFDDGSAVVWDPESREVLPWPPAELITLLIW